MVQALRNECRTQSVALEVEGELEGVADVVAEVNNAQIQHVCGTSSIAHDK
jgi:hypothetical protein